MMEQHCACFQRLWIIEYAWAHNILDVFKDMEASFWPDDDWGSLSLDESWRIRVMSAQVFSIVRNRQISCYERVLAFLENTYSLLPTLVPAIKHMKITFGLKTMVIMWMLREGAGPVSVVQKINKYFPRKLPQHQVHCRKHELFLMRRNQLDFRTFAQSLIMDKQKLEDYIQDHVEEEYGDRYAEKTEERLLDYLKELDKALPKETYIDKIMKKNSPVKEDEKALLDLITDDSKIISATLKKLLHCEAGTGTSNDITPESHVCFGVSTGQDAAERSTETIRHIQAPGTDTLMNDVGEVRLEQTVAAHTDESKATTCADVEKTCVLTTCPKSGAHVLKVPPHFCSKHQRWVRNILCECPGESSEEQPPQDSDISPLLFISTSSSSDLTPTNLTIPPDYHRSPSASNQLQKAEDLEFGHKAAIEPVDLAPPSHPGSFLEIFTLVAAGTTTTTTTVTDCPLKRSPTSNDVSEGSNQDSTSSSSNTAAKKQKHRTTTSPTPFVSKLSRRYRLGQKCSQFQDDSQEGDFAKNVEFSPQTGGFEVKNAASLSSHNTSRMDISTNTLTCSQLQAQASPAGHMAGSSGRMELRVVLKRMSTEECLKATKMRLHPRQCDDTEGHSAVSSFDINSLYSSSSSSSEEEEDSDTEYKPNRNTLRRWFLGY